jgi:hypothetical protein
LRRLARATRLVAISIFHSGISALFFAALLLRPDYCCLFVRGTDPNFAIKWDGACTPMQFALRSGSHPAEGEGTDEEEGGRGRERDRG